MSGYATAAAARLGKRAGERRRRTGLPSRNPFDGKRGREELAAAWRAAYFSAVGAGRSR